MALAEICKNNPYVENSCAPSAAGAPATTAACSRGLSPREHRPPVQDIVALLRRDFLKVPGITAFPQAPPSIQIGGRMSKSLYQYTLQGPDTQELYREAQKMEARACERA